MRVYGTAARITQVVRDVNAVLGYPSNGRMLDGAERTDGQGRTTTYALPERGDDGQWEYPADVPEKARRLLAGLPQRKHKERREPPMER